MLARLRAFLSLPKTNKRVSEYFASLYNLLNYLLKARPYEVYILLFNNKYNNITL